MVSLNARLGDADPDDATAEFERVIEGQKQTIADLRLQNNALRKSTDAALADRDHWKAYATTVEEGLQHVQN